MKKKEFLLYKIYYRTAENEDLLVYIGRTRAPMYLRLHNHFFPTRNVLELDIHRVSRIETASFSSEGDARCMEVILINREKPMFNHKQKAAGRLTLPFPECEFQPYESCFVERWREDVELQRRARSSEQMKREALFDERCEKRQEIYSNEQMSADEKAESWTKWLLECYEPRQRELNTRRRRRGGE